jgi:hypothetical protein
MLLSANPSQRHHARLHRENWLAISEWRKNRSVDWNAKLDTASSNIEILKTMKDKQSVKELLYILNSWHPVLQSYALPQKELPDRASVSGFFDIAEKISRRPKELRFGCIVIDLSWIACRSMLAIDREKAQKVLHARLDAKDERVVDIALCALAGHEPPLITLEEAKRHIATSKNPKALSELITDSTMWSLGVDAQRSVATQGMIKSSDYAGLRHDKKTRRCLRKLLRKKDPVLLDRLRTFLLKGEEAYTGPLDGNHKRRYESYFLRLWLYTETLTEVYPKCPRYPRWFWACASRKDRKQAKATIAGFLKAID